jgi:methylated-DNA-[protein]-cysteine S-methyltransferase
MKLETPFGPAWAAINEHGALEAFGFGEPRQPVSGDSAAVAQQVAEYFAGTRSAFELEMQPRGTAFQQRVWAELLRIPYGETLSYAQLAERVGIPGAARAVGRANATNPIALMVPCHRVIGSNGSLTGYAYGTELKRNLLELERRKPAA